jgi:hypothetical protein
MLLVEFFSWWYTRGFLELARKLGKTLRGIWQTFSVPLLLKTLFAPWKRITTEAGKSLQEHSRAWIDNAVSRLVGFTIRIFVIIAALASIVVVGLIGVCLIIAWPFVPPAIVYFMARMVV